MIVLLQRDRCDVEAVDLDILGLGVVGRDRSEAGEIHLANLPAARAVPTRSTIFRKPAGGCGIWPSLTPSSRSFSIAIAAYRRSGLTATESG